MKKWILFILALMMLLAGCGKETEDSSPTYTAPTLPSFDTTQTPRDKLDDAVEALKSAESFQMTFGTGDDIQTITLPQDAESLSQVKTMVPNEAFFDDLCRKRISFSPSNTGSFTLLLNGLTGEEFSALTGIATEAESCAITLIIAPEGYLSRLELQMDDTITFLQIDLVK